MAEAAATRRRPPVARRREDDLPRGHAAELAALFKVLGSPTRVRLLHVLVTRGETRAGELARALGMAPQAVSNQLRRLAAWDVVAARRHGTEVHYRLVNPCIEDLLAKGLCVVREEC